MSIISMFVLAWIVVGLLSFGYIFFFVANSEKELTPEEETEHEIRLDMVGGILGVFLGYLICGPLTLIMHFMDDEEE